MLVYALSGGLLASTIALNIVNVVVQTRIARTDEGWANENEAQLAFSDSVYGTAVLALSLATNFASTGAIGWKTWTHRRMIMKYFADFNRRSIVTKVMTLLWESGCVYCIIWVSKFGMCATVGWDSFRKIDFLHSFQQDADLKPHSQPGYGGPDGHYQS